jgi:hypothetical protein
VDEECVRPVLDPDQFQAFSVQRALFNFPPGEIGCWFSIAHAAIGQPGLSLLFLVECYQIRWPGIDRNRKSLRFLPAAFNLWFVVAGEETFWPVGIVNDKGREILFEEDTGVIGAICSFTDGHPIAAPSTVGYIAPRDLF